MCILEILLDHLKDIDLHPLIEVSMKISESEIDAVDVLNESSCALTGEYALLLMQSIKQKLRVVDLQDLSLGMDFLRYITVFIMHYCLWVNIWFLSSLNILESIFLLPLFRDDNMVKLYVAVVETLSSWVHRCESKIILLAKHVEMLKYFLINFNNFMFCGISSSEFLQYLILLIHI